MKTVISRSAGFGEISPAQAQSFYNATRNMKNRSEGIPSAFITEHYTDGTSAKFLVVHAEALTMEISSTGHMRTMTREEWDNYAMSKLREDFVA